MSCILFRNKYFTPELTRIRLLVDSKNVDHTLDHSTSNYTIHFDGSNVGKYRETDTTKPINVYGASKLAAEYKIKEIWCNHIIVRTSWIFAAHGNNFLNTIIRLLKEQKTVTVVDDQIGCPTPARSIAKMLLSLSDQVVNGREIWGTFHYCGRPETSWYDFAKEIFTCAGKLGCVLPPLEPISTKDYESEVTRPLKVVMDCTAIRRECGIDKPEWRPMIREYVEANLAKEKQDK